MDNLTSWLKGTAAYLDDILVVGRSKEELQSRIERLLKQIKEYGFHLRLDKCEFFLKSIKYLRFIFESGDRCPDPKKYPSYCGHAASNWYYKTTFIFGINELLQ